MIGIQESLIKQMSKRELCAQVLIIDFGGQSTPIQPSAGVLFSLEVREDESRNNPDSIAAHFC